MPRLIKNLHTTFPTPEDWNRASISSRWEATIFGFQTETQETQFEILKIKQKLVDVSIQSKLTDNLNTIISPLED